MRAPGMTWFRMPLFIWAHYATSLIMILGTSRNRDHNFLLLAFERLSHVGIFDPAQRRRSSSFPTSLLVLFTPGVYIMVLPGMGVVSELIANFSRKNILATSLWRSRAWQLLSLVFWFGDTTCLSPASRFYAGMIFSFLSFAVAILRQ